MSLYEGAELSADHVDLKSKKELCVELANRGLSAKGLKNELVARLKATITAPLPAGGGGEGSSEQSTSVTQIWTLNNQTQAASR